MTANHLLVLTDPMMQLIVCIEARLWLQRRRPMVGWLAVMRSAFVLPSVAVITVVGVNSGRSIAFGLALKRPGV